MAWNKTSTENQQQKKSSAKAPSVKRGFIAGAVIVVALGALCLYLFSNAEATSSSLQRKERGLIKEVTPAVAPKTNTAAEVKKPIDPREDYDHEKLYRDEKGILRHKLGGQRVYDPTRPALPPINGGLYAHNVFSNHAERVIAGLISVEPGSIRRARHDYSDPRLLEAFKEAVVTPCKISDSDSEYERELKLAVNETKKEIAMRIGSGEELGDILESADKELRRLAQYRQDINAEVATAVRDGELSNDDVKDLVAAANKMLEDNGINPIDEDSFVRWNIRLTATRNGEDPAAAVKAHQEQENQK